MVLPIILVAVAILLGVPLIFFTVAVIEMVKVILIILLFPFVVKYLSDYILYYLLDLDQKIAMVFGVIGSVIILYMLYMNFYALIIGGAIVYGIYILGRAYINKDPRLNAALSMTKWFTGGKR